MRQEESKGFQSNGLFYCNHVHPNDDLEDISRFTVHNPKGVGLAAYLRGRALNDELTGAMRTYLVRDCYSDELVGYFSLKAGLISGNETATEIATVFDTLPGIELANFAVNGSYLAAHKTLKGLGYIIFSDFILPLVESVSMLIGAQFLYIFALPFENLISRYGEYGFLRLNEKEEIELHARLKPKYDKGCIFMFQRINIHGFFTAP